MTGPKAENGTKKPRLTRQDWIDAATRRLIFKAIDAVRIESLAGELGVSRGSFYWHFRDRAALLEAILAGWRERQTRRIVERLLRDISLSSEERLAQLRNLPPRTRSSREAAALELAIRSWARRDKLARRVVDEVDEERLTFTASLLADLGLTPDQARHWALIGYAYTIGESVIRERMSDEQIVACRASFLRVQLREIDEQRTATDAALPALGPTKAAAARRGGGRSRS